MTPWYCRIWKLHGCRQRIIINYFSIIIFLVTFLILRFREYCTLAMKLFAVFKSRKYYLFLFQTNQYFELFTGHGWRYYFSNIIHSHISLQTCYSEIFIELRYYFLSWGMYMQYGTKALINTVQRASSLLVRLIFAKILAWLSKFNRHVRPRDQRNGSLPQSRLKGHKCLTLQCDLSWHKAKAA